MATKNGPSLSDEAAAFARALIERSRSLREAARSRRAAGARPDFGDTALDTQADFAETRPPVSDDAR